MPRAYSQDLRDRVIDAVVRGGESRRSASRRFGVSEASAIKWVQRYERAGDRCCAGTGGHRPSKVKPERDWLLAAIAAEPDITLAALSARLLAERGVRADTGTVRISVCGRAVEHYAALALMKRSPKMTANWALACDHSRGGIFHFLSERLKIR